MSHFQRRSARYPKASLKIVKGRHVDEVRAGPNNTVLRASRHPTSCLWSSEAMLSRPWGQRFVATVCRSCRAQSNSNLGNQPRVGEAAKCTGIDRPGETSRLATCIVATCSNRKGQTVEVKVGATCVDACFLGDTRGHNERLLCKDS